MLFSLGMVVALSFLLRFVSRFSELPGGESRLPEALPELPSLEGWPPAFIEKLKAAHEALPDPARQQAALRDLAMLYHANGFLAEAQAAYEMLEEMQPKDPRWPYFGALALADFGDPASVVEKLGGSIELDPSYSLAYLRLGDAALRLGEEEMARSAFERRLAEAPRDEWALLGLAHADLSAGRTDEALTKLREALEVAPDFAPAFESMAAALRELGRHEEAREFEQRAANAPPPVTPRDERAAALIPYAYDPLKLEAWAAARLRRGEIEDAERLLRRAVEVDPESPEAYLALARLYREQGREEEARRVLVEGLAASPESQQLTRALGEMLQSRRE